MNRRDFLTKSSMAALAGASYRAVAETPQTIDVTIGGRLSAPEIAPEFIGLGYEISTIPRGVLDGRNRVYVEMVRQLGARGVLRIGGNTADHAHYQPRGHAVSSPYGTMVNDEGLAELGTFLQETGWRLIWALNLGSGSGTEAVAEAKAVMAVAGERLLAFEIGNEPDLFSHEKHRPPSYAYEGWLADYRRYKAALRAQVPGIPLAGPDVAIETDWVNRFSADEGKDAVLLTHHYYREGQNSGSTIDKLLGIDPKLQGQLDVLRAAAESSKVPYRICEVNSFSGGGRPGVSDTMAGALWALDYLLTLAANGCSGVNMETGVNQLGFISSYSPLGDDEHGHYTAKPEYYGLLAFAQVGRGALLETTVESTPPLIKAYATTDASHALRLAFINKGPSDTLLRVSTGQKRNGSGHVLRLTAPRVDAHTGITLGGAEVSAQGLWKPAGQEPLQLRGGRVEVPLPAYSAALLEVSG